MKGGYYSASDFRQTEICSDCIERDDVDLLGRVRHESRGRVQECLGCRGTGRTRARKVDIVSWYVSTETRVS